MGVQKGMCYYIKSLCVRFCLTLKSAGGSDIRLYDSSDLKTNLLEIIGARCSGCYQAHRMYLLDLFCSFIQFYVLLSPCLCLIFFLYLDLYVLGDDACISKGSFMQTEHLCVLIPI